jgi:hypothetical protein
MAGGGIAEICVFFLGSWWERNASACEARGFTDGRFPRFASTFYRYETAWRLAFGASPMPLKALLYYFLKSTGGFSQILCLLLPLSVHDCFSLNSIVARLKWPSH